jgi:hypothetical protein
VDNFQKTTRFSEKVYTGDMTTYKCNLCDDISFKKESGLKRHQTRKHPGAADAATIEVLDNGKETVSTSKSTPRGRKTTAPKVTLTRSRTSRPVVIKEETEDTVTISRELLETLMKIAGVSAP